MDPGPGTGRTVLVTGATSGIGLETARALAKTGAHVVVGARDSGRGEVVVEELVRAGGSAELFLADMASFASVRQACERFAGAHAELHVLVNNAGIASRKRVVTGDGHELTWQTNFLSAFLLTRHLMPQLRKAGKPRVVNVSSEAHRSGTIPWDDLELARGYRGLKAYCQSKLALVLFARELARREPGVGANALHPGAIATNIWRAAPKPIEMILRAILPSPMKGARPVVRLATDPHLEGVTGRYFNRFREQTPAAAATNDADAVRLWEIAEKA